MATDTSPEQRRVAQAWTAYASDARKRRAWDAANPGNRANRRELLEMLLEHAAVPLAGEGPVLDAGCGTGWVLRALVDAGVNPIRLDGIDVAEARLERIDVAGARLRGADVRALPFPDGHFALVLLVAVLGSLSSREDVRATLLEAARVTAPGGAVLCYEPRVVNYLNPHTRLVRRRDFSDTLGGDHLELRSLTVMPPLIRRLGRFANAGHGLLGRVPLLRTHRLAVYRRPAGEGSP